MAAAALDPAGILADPAANPMANMSKDEQTELMAAIYYSQALGESLGPFLMGLVIDTFFCGIVITQFFRWVGSSSGDRTFTKVIVYSTVLLSIAYTSFGIAYQMRNFVFNFGTFAKFTDLKWIQFFVLGDALTATMIQIFYAERVFRLLGSSRRAAGVAFVLLLSLCVLAELGGSFAAIVVVNTRIDSLLDAYKMEPVLYVWLSGQLVADVVITTTTAYALYQNKTGWSNTDKLIGKLVRFTVETQFPPAVLALVMMVYFSQRPQSTIIVALK